MPFYATYVGHIRNEVFETWDECKREIHKTPKYKKFATRAEAEIFVEHGPFGAPEVSPFDAVVYTDGACRSNGRAGAIGGIGVYFAPNDARNVSRRLEGRCTNNVAELTALIEGVRLLPDGDKCAVVTDSNYAILCCSTYGDKLLKKGWPEDIPNRELVKTAYELVKQKGTKLVHVQAHTGAADPHSVGNHNADQLATSCLQ
jgi:ribonuclease HI